MKKFAPLIAVALTIAVAAPALGWHVNTGKDQQTVVIKDPVAKASSRGPAGDPYHRVIVKVKPSKVIYGACTGWVKVPDASWANGTTFTVDGTSVAIGRGETAHLAAGDYVGRWSNSTEVEYFTIQCDRAIVQPHLKDTVIGFSYFGKKGRTTKVVTIPEGCVYKSPWVWMKGYTKYWVQDRTYGKRLLTERAAKPGFYQPLFQGFKRGVSCPA